MSRRQTRRLTSLLVWVSLAACTQCVQAFVQHPLSFSRVQPFIQATTLQEQTAAQDDAARLRDQAAKIRAEIAALEGKTVQQVQDEAQEKKQREQEAREVASRQRKETRAKQTPVDYGRMLEVPNTVDEMIRQASRSIEMAYKDGKSRQTVRLALVQPDQSTFELNQWPGGAQQMYREAAAPLTNDLLTSIKLGPSNLPPKVSSQDIWDFDGSALHSGQSPDGAEYDLTAMVFANTDTKYIQDIESLHKSAQDRLLLLVNPFWRNIDSWGINLLAPKAKQQAQTVIFDRGFDQTYVFLRFSCRGEECVAIKAYPYDWQIFAYLEDGPYTSTVRLGSSTSEPKSSYVTELLNDRPEFKLSKTMRQMNK